MNFNLVLICTYYMLIQNIDHIQSQCKLSHESLIQFELIFNVSLLIKDSQEDKSGCVFPFTFKGQTFNECHKGQEPFPWCSYEKNFQGVWKYCYGGHKPSLT